MTLRWVQALVLGLAITLGLFWLMQYMILTNQVGMQTTRELTMIDFIRMKRDAKVKKSERRLPEKPPTKKRPPPPKMEIAQLNPVQNTLDLKMPNLDMPIQTDRFKAPIAAGLRVGPGDASSNLIPLVRISPRYPMRAVMKRLEGWVKVEFTITEEGAVKDVTVVESHPNRVFDREATRAIAIWKFKPKVIGGEPVQQRAVQTLEFKLKK